MNRILITSLTPYFLEKQVFWFEENLQQILDSAKSQPFFKENILFLEQKQTYKLFEILRRLDEMGYEKVFTVSDPGEFSHRGGVVDIFPVNMGQAVRLDFLGNALESIAPLDIKAKDRDKARSVLQKKLKSQKLFSDLSNLKVGDYVTHLDHGVARFCGIEKIQETRNNNQSSEYYVLEYAKHDKLFVPVGLERKLSRYVGFADPVISRLGSDLWQRTKGRIKEDVEKLARELLALYAQKELAGRKPYEIDGELEAQIKEGFAYEETPDQLQAIEDIRQDLLGSKPMDRIVCGDVGFGKTEVAIRTALFAAGSGYQVAIICPTTILANQHFKNFQKRFAKTAVKVVQLSRLQNDKEQQNVVRGLAEGSIDIVIGTHRLLSKDVAFKNLQLLILDDEQRFGVKQKEKLREGRPQIDMLSLSATPIPRTLYLALSSFKNVSLMQTPPIGRTAITTHIAPYNKSLITDAINAELARGGQVYFLHNRVQTLHAVVEKLKKLVPQATFGAIHGRMGERELLQSMEDFANNKTNVLVATTIIENGIDLPHVNTIIVEDASRLGLAQAYQIRGRVGRGSTKSFAYLFHPKHLPELAQERLRALGQATELGAGYQIALRDLELRGAGNILGREQSGAVNKIGLNLYCQMLTDAVEKIRE